MGKDAYGMAAALVAVVATTAVVSYKRSKASENSDDVEKAKSRQAAAQETWESHVPSQEGALQELVPDTLYVLETSGTSNGPPVRNMVIYKVPDKSGRLVIFNGIAVKDETLQEIESLGSPSVLIVPNCYHRCCAAVWKQKYPDMKVVCPQVAIRTVEEVVEVDSSTRDWAATEEFSKWVHTKDIDGWNEFENIIEVELPEGKKVVLVCDLMFCVPYPEEPGYADRFFYWMFDSSIKLPADGSIIIPKVARLSRIFGVKDWAVAEQWFRDYAKDQGKSIAAIVVGHGVPVMEVDKEAGCTEAFVGVADQLTKPRW